MHSLNWSGDEGKEIGDDEMSFKVVTVRKPHNCNACGGEILKGERAFVETVWEAGKSYPTTHYFHADDRLPNQIGTMSLNEIRKEICSVRR